MPEPSTEKTTVTTNGNTVKIEQPKPGKGEAHQKVHVIVGPDEVVGGFVNFLRENAIVGLAVGFAIGAQAQSVIKQLISSFIDPASQLLFGTALSQRTFTLQLHGRHANFGWGALFYTLLNFIFVLAAIYIIIKLFNLDKLDKAKQK